MKGFAKDAVPKPAQKATLRRRVGYADEEMSITYAKLASLELKKDKDRENVDARMTKLD